MTLRSREQLYSLLARFRDTRLGTTEFCDRFEQIYMELDEQSMTGDEAEAIDALFETVIWFSPYPEERARIANYVDEKAIRAAVAATLERLEGKA